MDMQEFNGEAGITPTSQTTPSETTQVVKNNTASKKQLLSLIDRVFEWCLYGLVFLIPLFFLPFTSDVLEFNKQTLLFVGTFILALLFALRVVFMERIQLRPTLVYIGFGAWLIVWLCASIFSLYPYTSFVGIEKQEFMSFSTILTLILFACILINALEKKTIIRAASSLLLSVTLATIFGLLQLWNIYLFPWDFTKTNAFNTIGLTSLWGGVIAIALIISLVGILRLSFLTDISQKQKQNLSILLSLFASLSLITLIIIGNWHLWLSVFIGTCFFLGFLIIKLPKKERILWLLLPSFVIALSLILTFFSPPRIVALPLQAQPTFQTSFSVTLQELKQSPLFGSGPGTYFSSFSHFRSKELNKLNLFKLWDVRFDQSGSTLLTVLSSIGILGLLGILIFVALFLYKVLLYLIKEPLTQEYILLLGTVSALIVLRFFSIFEPSNITLVFLFWLFVASATYITSSKERISHDQDKNRFLLVTSLSLYIILSLGLVGLFFTFKRYQADVTFAQALVLDQKLSGIIKANQNIDQKELDTLIDYLTRATQQSPKNHTYPRVLSQALLYKIHGLAQTQADLEKNKLIVQPAALLAIDAAKRSVTLNPHDSRNTQNAAQVYKSLIPLMGQNQQGALDAIEDYYKKSIELDPTNPELIVEVAKFHLDLAAVALQKTQQGKTDSEKSEAKKDLESYLSAAEKNLTQAKDVKEDYAPTYYYLSLIQIQHNQKDDAITNLDKSTQFNAQLGVRDADPFLFYLTGLTYNTLGQKAKAQDSFNSAVLIKPDYQLALWQLGTVLAEEQKKDDAIKVLEMLLKLDPQNKVIQDKIKEVKEGKQPEATLPPAAAVQTPPPTQPQTPQQKPKETPKQPVQGVKQTLPATPTPQPTQEQPKKPEQKK